MSSNLNNYVLNYIYNLYIFTFILIIKCIFQVLKPFKMVHFEYIYNLVLLK